jgi:hypothetical protein
MGDAMHSNQSDLSREQICERTTVLSALVRRRKWLGLCEWVALQTKIAMNL